jgi:hypothetical protein
MEKIVFDEIASVLVYLKQKEITFLLILKIKLLI